MSGETAKEFRDARRAAGLTQYAASVRTGVSVKTIRAWEQGIREPAYRAGLEYLAALKR